MAQPPIYQRSKDFTVDYANESDHSAINNELDGAATSINAIRTNLALIQKDDGGLKNGIVTADSIHPAFIETLSEEINAELGVSFSELSLGQYFKETFLDGVDYTAGTTTQITLDGTPSTKANTTVHFDGVLQHQTEYELAVNVITFDAAIPSGVVQVEVGFANTLSEGLIGDGSVTTAKLNDGAVTAAKINDLAITTGKMDDLSVTEGKIGNLSVTEGKIGALAVTTGKIGALAITNSKLALLSVATGNLIDLSVSAAKLSDSIVADLTAVTPDLGDSLFISDVSDSGKKKRALVSGLTPLILNGPTFRAANTSSQSITTATPVKVALGTEEHDTNGYFASSRFTPLVPGYYQLVYRLAVLGAPITSAFAFLKLNSSEVDRGSQIDIPSGAGLTQFASAGSIFMYLNGTTNFIELWVTASGTTLSVDYCRLSGAFIRP